MPAAMTSLETRDLRTETLHVRSLLAEPFLSRLHALYGREVGRVQECGDVGDEQPGRWSRGAGERPEERSHGG